MNHHEILAALSNVMKLLKGDNPTPLSFPADTPAGRAYYALTSLYISILIGTQEGAPENIST
jgi:hypothetical protein